MAYLAWLSIGGLSGFCAGLFGVGGGLIIVPALMLGLPLVGVNGPETMKIAVATSLAVIIPTTFVSSQAHAARGAVDSSALLRLAPGVVIGAMAGAHLATLIDVWILTTLFIGFLLVTAYRLGFSARSESQSDAPLPGALNLSIKGVGIGGISSLLGIGGATLAAPLLSGYINMPRAVGTSSALGLVLAVAGVLGYAAAAQPSACAGGCVGYIFLPAVGMIGLGAVLAAPHGARLTHRLPVGVLKRAFAFLLIIVAFDLAYKMLLL
jgi:uncharacterized membrane protein YfcA